MIDSDVLERPDLDGRRLIKAGGPDVWLVFHGRKHRITSPSVYDSLFGEISGLLPLDEVASVADGPELAEGTCLVRAVGTLGVHLLARGEDGRPRRYFVPTYESLVGFGFDEGRINEVPLLVLEGLESGQDLISATDRAVRPQGG